ncbi:MAG: excinuclease ABC subunit A [Flavobacteriales bacterium]|nr:excinuclease ABC subunit A [Flavobacteriales bacterium]|tara:strand:- start:418 stop:3240 length:2823 start_codon:yes stop_codon:yes gene_type:complete
MDIKIVGARENNLKNIDINIPSKKIIVFTGVSGSGKSSLAFDTIHKEGQRRYLETFSSYARNFIGSFERPKVDHITGLSPVISIEQKTISKNPRSTVGTITEIYDYLRLLFAKISEPVSFHTQEKMVQQNENQILELIQKTHYNQKILILAPKIKARKGHYSDLFQSLIKKGYIKAKINNEIINITPELKLDRYKTHNIDVVIDKLTVNNQSTARLIKSIKIALEESNGSIIIQQFNNSNQTYYSKHLTCPTTGISYENPEPNSFSFNSPKGYCQACKGLGFKEEININSIIPNTSLNIQNGGIVPIGAYKNNWIFHQIELIGKKHNFSLNTAIHEIPKNALQILLYGTKESFKVKNQTIGITKKYEIDFEGIINFIENQYTNNKSQKISTWAKKFFKQINCPVCNNQKLKTESLFFLINNQNIIEVSNLNIFELKKWCQNILQTTSKSKLIIAQEILKEVMSRLNFLIDIGLGYITLSRKTETLSGGESQRIKIASQIGSELSNVLYILDEPSIGLHPSDNALLIKSLKNLKNLGNSIIIVEHDKTIIKSADYIVDIGPGAGEKGGKIMFQGLYKDLKKSNSLTAKYLIEKKRYSFKEKLEKSNTKYIKLFGAQGNNLKNVNLTIPLSQLIVVTGVSGSGKSTLINGTLFPAIYNYLNQKQHKTYSYEKITGLENIDKIINIDQRPIGRTPRSNPATYIGFFTEIRKLYANLKESKVRGYNIGRFSFNVKNGNCTNCEGNGYVTVQMKLLPDIEIPCKTCLGKRFNPETLEIYYKNKNIYDVLEMSIDEAITFFDKIPSIKQKITALQKVGMGYIKIGQSSTKLSGGEAQRVKLASELSKKDTGKTLYILDEPTTGLHCQDITVLMNSINLLVNKGNTVIIIEHNTDVIQQADHIVDLGPQGGSDGGTIIHSGNVKSILNNKTSRTGFFLKKEIYSQNE